MSFPRSVRHKGSGRLHSKVLARELADQRTRSAIHPQLEHVRPGLMADRIEIEFRTRDFVHVEIGNQHGLASINGADQFLAEGADDAAAAANENGPGSFPWNGS